MTRLQNFTPELLVLLFLASGNTLGSYNVLSAFDYVCCYSVSVKGPLVVRFLQLMKMFEVRYQKLLHILSMYLQRIYTFTSFYLF